MRAQIKLFTVMAASLLLFAACGKKTETAPAAAPAAEATAPASTMPATPVAAGTGEMCGGIAGIQCKNTTDYCAKPIGTCQVADGSGTCTAKPAACTLEHKPVCGCDGKTYPTACAATVKGVNVASEGACK